MLQELPSSDSSQVISKELDLPFYKSREIIAVSVVIFYVILSVFLIVAAFLSQSMFLLPIVPLLAGHWAYAFRKAIDKLLASK